MDGYGGLGREFFYPADTQCTPFKLNSRRRPSLFQLLVVSFMGILKKTYSWLSHTRQAYLEPSGWVYGRCLATSNANMLREPLESGCIQENPIGQFDALQGPLLSSLNADAATKP